MEIKKKHIAILGATGSIGTQALEVIDEHPERFVVEGLTANNNSGLLIAQSIKYRPSVVVITNGERYHEVNDVLSELGIKVFSGERSLEQVVENDNIDIVLTALVGYSGLKPTLRAIKSGKNIALANKETLVVAGDLITRLCHQHGARIFPVDSEHFSTRSLKFYLLPIHWRTFSPPKPKFSTKNQLQRNHIFCFRLINSSELWHFDLSLHLA